ncbi:type II secretion system protein [Botrimarina hoheduenensis]|uniref:Type II secretion system protein G n=1 Tax=Botrimarina hoheduenensis TaxID=2528000 RepID=A0A5C5W8M4_9BACT|nr:type II secretion system protein [Botrimarina hoheduenensis]TWT46817.1 hypothetical protein Pla111_19190 [Botrimarina hoheduenensis]
MTPSAPPTPLAPAGVRRGLTLVELLVAIAIVAILATLLLGVAARAGRTAREARTKQLIARLHTLVSERYEEYRAQRVELNERLQNPANPVSASNPPYWFTFLQAARGPSVNTLNEGQQRAYGRLFALREQQRIEMPDRWSDIALTPLVGTVSVINATDLPPNAPPSGYDKHPRFIAQRTPLNLQHVRRYNALWSRTNTLTKQTNTLADVLRNESAECLYLTVMNTTGDGEARGLFKESDMGDTDGDGAPEFLDAWGNPIGWLRWPAGYDSDLQLSYDRLARLFNETPPTGQTAAETMLAALDDNHDPLDLFRIDRTPLDATGALSGFDGNTGAGARGWRLVPLIYSAGPDQDLGLYTGLVETSTDTFQQYFAALSDPYNADPGWSSVSDIPPPPLGIALSASLDAAEGREQATDNLTNHLIEAR